MFSDVDKEEVQRIEISDQYWRYIRRMLISRKTAP